MADAWTHWETRPVTIHERERYKVRQARYACRECQGIAILAEATESILAAAVEHRRGVRLPTRRLSARAVIADEIARVDVLPAQPGQAVYCPERLRVTWADGTTAQGAPLDMRSPIPTPVVPPTASAAVREAAFRTWCAASWQAIYERAGATLAG